MAEWIEDLSGDEWEEYSGALLRLRYDPVDVQAVPDIEGDLGIDYWIRGNGDVYQCYGPEHATSVSDRLRLQKRKLSQDIKKLIHNSNRIAELLSPARCRRYVFLVPRHDSKELLELAAAKAREVRGEALPCCDSEFEISVHSLKDFRGERKQLMTIGVAVPRLSPGEPLSEEVDRWLVDNHQFAKNIREKLEAIHNDRSEERIEGQVQDVAQEFVTGEDALRGLEESYGQLYEKVRRVLSRRRRRLAAFGGATSQVGIDILVTELDGLAMDLEENAGLDKSDAMTVAIGTVAQWLADCTLDPR